MLCKMISLDKVKHVIAVGISSYSYNTQITPFDWVVFNRLVDQPLAMCRFRPLMNKTNLLPYIIIPLLYLQYLKIS